MRVLRIAAPLVCLLACSDEARPPPSAPVVEQPLMTQGELRDQVRQLWTQRVFWTRNYLVDALAELPPRDATLRRLMQNQAALGEALKPFYGDDAGDQFTALLQENVTLAGLLINAARDGEDLKTLADRWQASTARVGGFLADRNPSLSRDELLLQLQGSREATMQQITERLAANWDADLAAADTSRRHAVKVADGIAAGLAARFPAKISTSTDTNEQTLHVALRELWEDHANWQRMYFVSDLSRLPDVTAVGNRLRQNQVDLGRALAPHFGGDLEGLLTQHIGLASEVLRAAESRNDEGLSTAMVKWQANGDAIAASLASASQHLDEATLKALLRAQREQLLAEVKARLSGDYAAEIAAHDLVEQYLLVISDAISRAIATAFAANTKSDG